MSMSTIVSYIKHFDNDTKGTIEISGKDIVEAVTFVRAALIEEALDTDGVNPDAFPAELFTITKAEVAEARTNWTGVPKAAF